MKQNFVKTSNIETAEKLRQSKFTELSKEGNFFVFMNDGKMLFEEEKEIVYTNKICM